MPVTQEVEVEDHEFEASQGIIARPCLKNKIRTKGLG
jgi:hypothetical protein